MSRPRNPEIYVKGYGKNITKDDLKGWFREFGKIVCIQYKGPYSFIVTFLLLRNLKTTLTPKLLSNKWMTKKWKEADLLSSLPDRKRTEAGIAKGVIVMTEEAGTEGEGIFKDNIVLLHQVHHLLHLHLVVLDHHPQALVPQNLRARRRKKRKDDGCWFLNDMRIIRRRGYIILTTLTNINYLRGSRRKRKSRFDNRFRPVAFPHCKLKAPILCFKLI